MQFTKYVETGALHWGKLSGRGPRGYHARLHARYGWFVERAKARPGLLLEVGCGDGALLHLLSLAAIGEVIGIEPESRGVELAEEILRRRDSRARVVQGVGESLPIDDAAASTVVLCEVIEHVEKPAVLLGEAARVLAPDGILLLSTPQRQRGPLPRFHVREYEADQLAEACREFFEDVQIEAAEPAWLVDAYGWRIPRLLVNTVSLLGLNPFAVVQPVSSRHRRWRQLYVLARRPQHVVAARGTASMDIG